MEKYKKTKMTSNSNTSQNTDLTSQEGIECTSLTVPSMSPKLLGGIQISKKLDIVSHMDMVCYAGRSTFRRARQSSVQRSSSDYNFEDYSFHDENSHHNNDIDNDRRSDRVDVR